MNRKARVACKFNYHFEHEGLLKVIAIHTHRRLGNISKTMPDGRCYHGPILGSDIPPIE